MYQHKSVKPNIPTEPMLVTAVPSLQKMEKILERRFSDSSSTAALGELLLGWSCWPGSSCWNTPRSGLCRSEEQTKHKVRGEDPGGPGPGDRAGLKLPEQPGWLHTVCVRPRIHST